jgi:transposase-like protein
MELYLYKPKKLLEKGKEYLIIIDETLIKVGLTSIYMWFWVAIKLSMKKKQGNSCNFTKISKERTCSLQL